MVLFAWREKGREKPERERERQTNRHGRTKQRVKVKEIEQEMARQAQRSDLKFKLRACLDKHGVFDWIVGRYLYRHRYSDDWFVHASMLKRAILTFFEPFLFDFLLINELFYPFIFPHCSWFQE